MRLNARVTRRTACAAPGRGVGWLAVIEVTPFWSCLPPAEPSELDNIQTRAKAPQPALGGRPISGETSLRRQLRPGPGMARGIRSGPRSGQGFDLERAPGVMLLAWPRRSKKDKPCHPLRPPLTPSPTFVIRQDQ